MRPFAVLAGLAALGAMALCAASDRATAAPESAMALQDESRAQATRRKVLPKIRVQRGYPYRRTHALYPLPYEVEYPGPNGIRHCANRYVTERRPSGNVIVPHMRCWWVVRR